MDEKILGFVMKNLEEKATNALARSEYEKREANRLLAMAQCPKLTEFQVYIDSAAGWVDKQARASNMDLATALAEAECDFIEMYGGNTVGKYKVSVLIGDSYPDQELFELPKEMWESLLQSQPNLKADEEK